MAKLALVQDARGKAPPDENDTCLQIVRRLPPGIYDEIKALEATNPAAPELHSLFTLRLSCVRRFHVWVQNHGGGRGAKRTLAAIREDDPSDNDEHDGDLYAFRGDRRPGHTFVCTADILITVD